MLREGRRVGGKALGGEEGGGSGENLGQHLWDVLAPLFLFIQAPHTPSSSRQPCWQGLPNLRLSCPSCQGLPSQPDLPNQPSLLSQLSQPAQPAPLPRASPAATDSPRCPECPASPACPVTQLQYPTAKDDRACPSCPAVQPPNCRSLPSCPSCPACRSAHAPALSGKHVFSKHCAELRVSVLPALQRQHLEIYVSKTCF